MEVMGAVVSGRNGGDGRNSRWARGEKGSVDNGGHKL